MARFEATLTTRGYELDADALVPPVVLLRYVEHCRWQAFDQALPFIAPMFRDGAHMVVRAQWLALERSVGYGVELGVSLWAGRVGTSSVDFHHELRRIDDGSRVAQAVVTGVYLGTVGRPQPLPAGVSEEVEAPLPDAPTARAPRLRRPSDAWTEQRPARWSEQDLLRHVNQANYLAYFDDLRRAAAQAGQYGAEGETGAGRLVEAALEYRSPALAGQDLELATWPLTDDPAGFDIGCEAVRGSDGERVAAARLRVGGDPR